MFRFGGRIELRLEDIGQYGQSKLVLVTLPPAAHILHHSDADSSEF